MNDGCRLYLNARPLARNNRRHYETLNSFNQMKSLFCEPNEGKLSECPIIRSRLIHPRILCLRCFALLIPGAAFYRDQHEICTPQGDGVIDYCFLQKGCFCDGERWRNSLPTSSSALQCSWFRFSHQTVPRNPIETPMSWAVSVLMLCSRFQGDLANSGFRSHNS